VALGACSLQGQSPCNPTECAIRSSPKTFDRVLRTLRRISFHFLRLTVRQPAKFPSTRIFWIPSFLSHPSFCSIVTYLRYHHITYQQPRMQRGSTQVRVIYSPFELFEPSKRTVPYNNSDSYVSRSFETNHQDPECHSVYCTLRNLAEHIIISDK
jgi:hypothetical protein